MTTRSIAARGRAAGAALLAAALAACVPAGRGVAPPARVTHGVAAGDVGPTHASLWARCSRPGTLHVALRPAGGAERRFATAVGAATDHAATLRADGLAPGTEHVHRAWCDGAEDAAVAGRFRTPPPADVAAPVRLAWGGDVGGQNVCRDAALGYPVFDVVAARAPDVFVALGDMIYADDPCLARGRYGNAQVPGPPERAVDVPGYWAHWRYNRADGAQQRLLAATAVVAVWDDHEIANDAGPTQDRPTWPGAPDVALLPLARAAFRHWNPVGDGPLYRRLRLGRHVELFALDTRSYRDANAAPDDPRRPKSLLGAAQRAWLVDGLRATDATWKVVVSSVPMAIPTADPTAPDGWANGASHGGFEQELLAILAAVRRVPNLIWITTDVHHATAFRHRPFGAAGFPVHEVVTGPLHAGVFAQYPLDPTLRPERLAFHGPPSPRLPSLDAARDWFTFGLLAVDADGTLRAEIVDGRGRTRWTTTLAPAS